MCHNYDICLSIGWDYERILSFGLITTFSLFDSHNRIK